MNNEYEKLEKNLISIASEFFRLQGVINKVMSKIDVEEQLKYNSQFSWFSKKVYKALEDSEIRLICLDGQKYDVGMSVTPLNIEEFSLDDTLYVDQTVEPIIMKNDSVIKVGTVILRRGE